MAEVVLAIGNPFGLAQTVTMGIVSAIGRANVGIADYEDFIQTDAAINPGNSGGALVNAGGALIGINTAIFTQSGGYMGIGFAVPINMARQVMDQLVTRGRLNRGYLGVAVQELTPAVARGLGLSVEGGILVADVTPGGPAAQAGLQRGDVITGIDGKPVDRRRPLPQSRRRDGPRHARAAHDPARRAPADRGGRHRRGARAGAARRRRGAGPEPSGASGRGRDRRDAGGGAAARPAASRPGRGGHPSGARRAGGRGGAPPGRRHPGGATASP